MHEELVDTPQSSYAVSERYCSLWEATASAHSTFVSCRYSGVQELQAGALLSDLLKELETSLAAYLSHFASQMGKENA
jgi:hypothetical protein